MNNNKVVFDRNTDTQTQIEAGSVPAIEAFARSLQAAYAAHNTNSSYDIAMAQLTASEREIPDAWLLVALDTQRAIQQRTGLPANLQEIESGSGLRTTKPVVSGRTASAAR